MIKILILQAQHNLSDARMEFMIRDRLSGMRFLGFSLGDRTPDENYIRHFRNRMTETGTLKRVMKTFDWQLHKKGKTAAEIWPDEPAGATQKNTDARWTLKVVEWTPFHRRANLAESEGPHTGIMASPRTISVFAGLQLNGNGPASHCAPSPTHPRTSGRPSQSKGSARIT